MKQEDIWEHMGMCNKCNVRLEKTLTRKANFEIRTWHCRKCGKKIFHPIDLEKYSEWEKIKDKPFEVKVREVGNSFTVSIPKEIIKLNGFQGGEKATWTLAKSNKLILNIGNKTTTK